MDRWLGKVVALLESEDRRLRRAAARVLSALQPTAPEAVTALGKALHSGDPRLRLRALGALGAIGGPSILESVLPLLDEEGEIGRLAADILARSGPHVLASVKKGYAAAGPMARRRMLRIAVLVRGAEGMDLLVKALQNGQAHEVLEVGDALAKGLEGAPSRERNILFRRVDKFLTSKAARADPDSAGAAVDLIARILGPDSLARLLAYAEPRNQPFVRRRALAAVARVAPNAEFTSGALSTILGYLKESDYANVVAPAMAVLERAPLRADHAPMLLKSLKSGDPALRRFAVTALGQVDTPKSAAALLEIFRGDNPDLQKRAALSLAKQNAAVPLVVTALAKAQDPRTAWVLARILHPHVHGFKPDQVAALASVTAAWLEPGDSRAEAVISVLDERYMEFLADAGLKRIRRLKRERNAGGIVNVIRPLLRNGATATLRVRYEVALAEIVRGKKDVVREVRLSNPGLQALEPLLHENDFGLLTRLKREKHFLNPEEYYLIGCHFAERPFMDRIFGGDILRWVVQTFPDDASATAAENKLIMEGFPPPPQRRKKKALPKMRTARAIAAAKKAPKKAVARKKPAAVKKPKPKAKKAAAKKTAKKKTAKKSKKRR